MLNRRAIVTILLALGTSSTALAGFDEIITFDEVPFGTAADGLSIKNVGFSIQGIPNRGLPSIAAGPGTTPYVSSPVLEGPTLAALGLNFAQPVNAFGFGFALSVGGAVPNAVIVDVFDPQGNFLETFTANGEAGTRGGSFFSSGQLVIQGLGPIGSATVNFADYVPTGATLSDGIPIARFAFDNLGYDFSAVVIPLPTPALLSAAGLLGLSARRRRSL